MERDLFASETTSATAVLERPVEDEIQRLFASFSGIFDAYIQGGEEMHVSSTANRTETPAAAWVPRELPVPAKPMIPARQADDALDTQPSKRLPRYTPEQIRRNRLKAVVGFGVVALSAAFGLQKEAPSQTAPQTVAVSAAEDTVRAPEPTIIRVEAPVATIAAEPAAAENTAAVVAQAQTSTRYEGSPTTDGTRKGNQQLAHYIAKNEYGLSDSSIACMDLVVHGNEQLGIPAESHYDTQADNKDSTAYGIAQAMLSLHKDQILKDYPDYFEGTIQNPFGGNPRTQIRWMLDYMKERYGGPCKAWAYKRVHKVY